MCDKPHFENLEERVDELEKQVAVINSTQNQMREEMKQGFADIKMQMNEIYEERRAWSAWLRQNLPVVGKWLGKWIIILTIAAIGINNAPALIKAVLGAAAAQQQQGEVRK